MKKYEEIFKEKEEQYYQIYPDEKRFEKKKRRRPHRVGRRIQGIYIPYPRMRELES